MTKPAEEWQKLRSMRRHFRTAELSDDEVEQIASARMDPRHDHLYSLLDPKKRGRSLPPS